MRGTYFWEENKTERESKRQSERKRESERERHIDTHTVGDSINEWVGVCVCVTSWGCMVV